MGSFHPCLVVPAPARWFRLGSVFFFCLLAAPPRVACYLAFAMAFYSYSKGRGSGDTADPVPGLTIVSHKFTSPRK